MFKVRFLLRSGFSAIIIMVENIIRKHAVEDISADAVFIVSLLYAWKLSAGIRDR